MKWIIKYYLICIFLCVPFLTKGKVVDSIFSTADSLYENGDFFQAGIAYEYIVYTTASRETKVLAQIKRIDCFTQDGSFKEAQHYAEKVSLLQIPDSLQFIIRYKRALNAYLAGHFNEAKSHFLQLRFYHRENVFERDYYPVYLLTLNELKEWQTAKKEWLAWINQSNLALMQKDSLAQIVETLYHKKNIPKLKSIKRAKTYSTFIPGSGQIYAGYPLEGIFNLTIHLASLAFAAEEILAGFYITGYLGGFGLFQKLYFGGIRRTEYLVNKTNYKRAREFNREAKAFVLKIE